MIIPHGPSPLYGVHFRLWEPSRYTGLAALQIGEEMVHDYIRDIGDLSTHRVVVLEPTISLTNATSKEFAAEIGARNGYVFEQIKLIKTQNGWAAAYRVQKQVGTQMKTLLIEIDPGLKEKVSW